MARGGVIAALAACLTIVGPACADEASVRAAINGRVLSSVVGVSSYYGPGFNGHLTAAGEPFDSNGITAAHKTWPIPCYARVTNLANGRSIVVRVNDRGPFVAGRIVDVSERVSKLLGYFPGMSRVRLDYLGKAAPAGGDETRALMASLHTSGAPVAVAKAKPVENGVTAVSQTPALGYSETPAQAPAAAALAAAVRPVAAPAPAPLGLAAQLDASARQLQSAIETTHRTVESGLSPYGQLVVAPFKRLIEAAR